MGNLGPRNVLIDSSVIIAHWRRTTHSGGASLLEQCIKECEASHISVISIYEVEVGARLAGRESDINPFLAHLNILDVDAEIAKLGASIFAALKQKNVSIQNRDILIAATAQVHELPVLTLNVSHFKHVPGLKAGHHLYALR